MDEKENKLSEETAEIDTVSGDNENTETNKEKQAPKKERTPMSARTKKRLIRVAVVTLALLVTLAAVLITVTVINNRPPEFSEVKGRFQQLITDSQAVNEMIWGAGLPTYSRVDREIKTFEVEFEVEIKKKVEDENGNLVEVKEKKLVQKTLGYYLFEDDTYGTVVSYEYQARVMTGETTDVKLENGEMQSVAVYTIYDVEKGTVLAEYKNGASRFARKTQTPIAGESAIFEKNGYYYYALPGYENEDLAYAGVYNGKEDSHYDYVRFDQACKNTDDVKRVIESVYAAVFVTPLYENLFTGLVGATNDVYQAAYIDYIDEENGGVEYLMKSNDSTSAWKWRDPLPAVEFDFSTMQMIDGNAGKVTVGIDYRLAGSEQLKHMEIDFVLEEGAWLLNSPTFG